MGQFILDPMLYILTIASLDYEGFTRNIATSKVDIVDEEGKLRNVTDFMIIWLLSSN